LFLTFHKPSGRLNTATNGDCFASKQGHTIAGMALDASGQLEFQQNRDHERGRQLALSHDFVNRR
jgi:hypothetical protein